MAGPAIIEYRLTQKDYVAHQFHYFFVRDTTVYRKYRRAQFNLFVVFLLATVFTGFAGRRNLSNLWLWALSWASLTFFMLTLTAAPRFREHLRTGIRRQLKKEENADHLATRWISLTSDGVLQATEHLEIRCLWNGVTALAETPGHLFLYFGGFEAVIVPRRAFADDFAYADFVATARSFFDSAHKLERREP